MVVDMLTRLRNLLKLRELEAYLIPSGDAHQSEYIAACDGRRGFISGFTGSAGYAIVTADKAALWTDGRYYLQAEKQLKTGWELMKDGLPETPNRTTWLKNSLKDGARIGFDPQLISIVEYNDLKRSLPKLSLVPLRENLIDQVWTDRPQRPANPLIALDLKYAGKSHTEKIDEVKKYLIDYKPSSNPNKKVEAVGFLTTALDEICWVLNLRGSDIPFNPVFFAYFLVTNSSNILFTDTSRIDSNVHEHLKKSRTKILPYESLFDELNALSKSLGTKDVVSRKLVVGECANFYVSEAIGNDDLIEIVKSPIKFSKSIKNPTELDGFRKCHLRDASALCNFFGWLENELKNNSQISEVDAADKLEYFRSTLDDFMGLSFDTISSTGSNGAIIHYKPEQSSCKIIDKDSVYLCDSGAQYRDGTTDVTRTYHFGTANDFEKLAFTRVLQGHIALDSLVFPEGTSGYQIDAFARSYLWKSGLNYMHGTGHGVGSFLNVHEGPHGISYRKGHDECPLAANMTVTNEPGYYHSGKFGIRIENILLITESQTLVPFSGKKFLQFENVTFVPIGRNLIEKSLLSPAEIEWVNSYHDKCRKDIAPLLNKDGLGYKWLMKETEAL